MSVLLITGGRTFCEAIPDKSREEYMAERVALGFALDMIGPSAVVTDGREGAGRWAAIWADRRSVPVSSGKPDAAIVFPGGYTPTDLPIYQASIT